MNEILSLLLLQYKASPNLAMWITALIATPYLSTVEDITPLRTLYGIDESEGVQLDGIGSIVGEERPKSFNDADIFAEGVFTLGDSNEPQPQLDTNLGFGDINDSGVGGRWDRGAVEGSGLGDIEYRNLLKGRVHVNRSRGTIADYEEYGRLVFGQAAHVYPSVGSVLVIFPYYLNIIALEVVKRNIQMTLGIRTQIGSMAVPNRKVFTYSTLRSNTPIEVLSDILDEDGTPIVTDEGVPLASVRLGIDAVVSSNGAGYARFENDPESGYMITLQTA